jgi:hypothetical protein
MADPFRPASEDETMKKRLVKIKVFVGETRPCYDSAPLAEQDMTESEANTLRTLIGSYMRKCRNRREAEKAKERRPAHAARNAEGVTR